MDGTRALTVQMLEWLDERPRKYADTLDAWKTSCPRLSIWEDALADGLIRVEDGAVRVTDAGRNLLRQPPTTEAVAVAASISSCA